MNEEALNDYEESLDDLPDWGDLPFDNLPVETADYD